MLEMSWKRWMKDLRKYFFRWSKKARRKIILTSLVLLFVVVVVFLCHEVRELKGSGFYYLLVGFWHWLGLNNGQLIALGAITAVIVSSVIGYYSIRTAREALKISTRGSPIIVDVNLRKGDHYSPFVVMVTNEGVKDFLPLQIVLEIKDLNEQEIELKRNPLDKKTATRIYLKYDIFENKHRDDMTENFRIIPSGSRSSYRLEKNQSLLYPTSIVEKIQETLELLINRKKITHFLFYGGVEVPSKDCPYRLSEEYIEVNFDKDSGLMLVRHSTDKNSEVWQIDQHYRFQLIYDRDMKRYFVKEKQLLEYGHILSKYHGLEKGS